MKMNEAGGIAYERTPKNALATLVCAGTMRNTYYVNSADQQKNICDLLPQVPLQFVAKLAVYAANESYMKDTPVFLLAYLACQHTELSRELLEGAFPLVIQNGKTLRKFVEYVRSGVFGVKSLGSSTKKLVRQWFADRDAASIYFNSIGSGMSLADVIMLSHPRPNTAEKAALFGYLTNKERSEEAGPGKYRYSDLPKEVRLLKEFADNPVGELPHAPYAMLQGMNLNPDQWKTLTSRLTWSQLRQSLNLLNRKGVWADSVVREAAIKKLSSPQEIERARVLPYQLFATATSLEGKVSGHFGPAISGGLKHSLKNIPAFEKSVCVCVDTSGSMGSAVTGTRAGVGSVIRCVDAAAIFAGAVLARNPETVILPFDTRVHDFSGVQHLLKEDPLQGIQRLAAFGGGGTNIGSAIDHMIARNIRKDLVIIISDNESWVQFAGYGQIRSGTTLKQRWSEYKKLVPEAKLVLIDIAPTMTSQYMGEDVLQVAGHGDSVFNVIQLFASGQMNTFEELIEQVSFNNATARVSEEELEA